MITVFTCIRREETDGKIPGETKQRMMEHAYDSRLAPKYRHLLTHCYDESQQKIS
jgi:hypothetical protein